MTEPAKAEKNAILRSELRSMWRFLPCEVGSLDGIESTNEMPCAQTLRACVREKFAWEFAGEVDARLRGGFEAGGEVAVQEFVRVSFIRGHGVDVAVRVVHR